ncbi:MAG TPA: hypothetical protein VKN18_00160 [Blastocatellia bacterium]|nr:hypothetical protein [Blastocatellia bacterium]
MATIYCQQCQRPNGASSKKCIWCEANLSGSSSTEIDTTTLEVDYVSGIDRLDNPGPVRMVISSEGIEIAEILPGSRSFKIPTASIIEVNVAVSSVTTEAKERPWWRRVTGSLKEASTNDSSDSAPEDFVFTVRYERDNEEGTMVFRRYDPNGIMPVWRIADTLGRLTGQRRGSASADLKRLCEKP